MKNLSTLFNDYPPEDDAAISPSQCAVVIGIPLTQSQFKADCEDPERNEGFAATFLSGRRRGSRFGIDVESAFHLYEQSSKRTNRVCDRVETLGVKVIRDSNPNVLRRLFTEYAAVTVITHFGSPSVHENDILQARPLIKKIQGPHFEHFVHRLVGDFVSHEDSELLHFEESGASIGEDELKTRLAKCLASFVRHSEAAYKSLPSRGRACSEPSRVVWDTVPRVFIEQAFQSDFRAAPSVEFRSGMATVAELKKQIPATYNGIIDLSLCNSSALGAALKLDAPRPAYGVVMNRYCASPDLETTIYQLTIETLAMEPISYWDARTVAIETIRRAETA